MKSRSNSTVNLKNSKRAVSKSPKRPSLISNSPKKKRPISLSQFIDKNKKQRQKTNNILDAYHLIMKTNGNLRCLQHSSIISLYCQTEQKLLCANCVYGGMIHRGHKVFPVEKCYIQIARDIEQKQRQSSRQLQSIKDYEKYICDSYHEQQKLASTLILELSQTCEEIKYRLNLYFEETKKKILKQLNRLIVNNEKLLIQLGHTRSMYESHKLPSAQKIQQQQQHVFYHSVGTTLIKGQKIQFQRIVTGLGAIKQTKQIEMKRMESIMSLIQTQDRNRQYNSDIIAKMIH